MHFTLPPVNFSSKPSKNADHMHHKPPLPPSLLILFKTPIALTMAITATAFRPLPASSKFRNPNPPPKSRSTKTLALSSKPTSQSILAKDDLLSLISDQERGLKTQSDPSRRSKIIKAIEALADFGKDTITTDAELLSATWRMLWTTEKEQLFIIKNAPLFGTRAGDVLQVIDVENRKLNNVITFPPSGVFFVRSTIEPAPPQRMNFRHGICNALNFYRFSANLGFLIYDVLPWFSVRQIY